MPRITSLYRVQTAAPAREQRALRKESVKYERRVHAASYMCLAVAQWAKRPPANVMDREVGGSTPVAVDRTFSYRFCYLPSDGLNYTGVFP